LFWYLAQHPQICPSSVKEPRYFLPLSEADEGSSGVLSSIEDYEMCFAHCGPQPYRMEATPGYFHGGPRLIRGIKATLGAPRIIISLRDPVERIWSIYRYAQSHLLLPDSVSFEEYVRTCEEVYRSHRLRPTQFQAYWSITASRYIDYIGDWLDAFGSDVRVVFFEGLSEDPRSVVEPICGWLGIDHSHADSFDYSVENRSIRYRSKVLQKIALAANRERFFRRHRRLKEILRRLYFRVNDRSVREAMPLSVRRYLRDLFRPVNEALAIELTKRGYADLPGWLTNRPTESASC
jgi:hypothetical protein